MRATAVTAVLALTLASGAAITSVGTAASAAATTPVARELITVQSASASATTATVKRWHVVAGGGYAQVGAAIAANVGALGIGQAHEGSSKTPAGVFTLTQAFGNQASNGTRLPYFRAGVTDWWDGLSGSARYNTHVRQAASPGGASENLLRAGAVYAHAVVIDYNRFPVQAGAGSAFFLHVSAGKPTAGCVSIPGAALDTVMRWLDPAAHPAISIGVGAAATAPITAANAAAAAAKHNPHGHLDSAQPSPQAIRVRGWAADPDALRSAVSVDVYIDGRAHGRFSTGVARPDVAAAVHTGPNQGYDVTIRGITKGRHAACVYAINLLQGNANPNLGCRTVTVS